MTLVTSYNMAIRKRRREKIAEKWKIFGKTFVDRNGNVVPLYRDSEEQKVTHLKAKSTALDDRKSPTLLQEVAGKNQTNKKMKTKTLTN